MPGRALVSCFLRFRCKLHAEDQPEPDDSSDGNASCEDINKFSVHRKSTVVQQNIR